ncbi:MAG: restriction endonuclease, partial [Candidatus Saccharimonadales bacterium]
FNLLVDAIPVLNKSKNDVLLFFQGAGVPADLTSDLARRLTSDPKSIGKYEIARTVLDRINKRGDASLRDRREVLRRVVGITNFDACWPNDQMKAKGLVTSIREIVNQKDAFTRMDQAREQERQARLAGVEQDKNKKLERARKINAAKQQIYALFGASLTPQQRGKKLEVALNNLFAAYDVLVSQAFHLVGDEGEGVIEQVDGVIELKGQIYFVEMKWYRAPVGVPEISPHLVRLMGRDQARGFLISASDFTDPALRFTRDFLQQKVLALCHVDEVVAVLDSEHDLTDFLNQKVQAAIVLKNPYFRPLDAKGGTRE